MFWRIFLNEIMLNPYISERTKNIPFYVYSSLCKSTSLIRYAHFFRKWLQYLYSYMNQMRSVFPYILWGKRKKKYEMVNTKHLLWKMTVIYVKSSNKRYKLKKKFRRNERGREMWKIFRNFFLQKLHTGRFLLYDF